MPSPGDLPDPRIEPGSPALQADSLPAELLGKPCSFVYICQLGLCLSKLKSPHFFCLFIKGYFSLRAWSGWWCGVWGREG